MNNQFDFIVVGAGAGGTTIASLLANENKKVLLIDKNPKPGGRMMTVNKWGHTYEMFPIEGVPGKNSLFEVLSDKLGKSHIVEPVYFAEANIIMDDKDGNRHHFTSVGSLFKSLSLRGKIKLICMVWKLSRMKETEINTLYHISAHDYMQQFKLPDLAHTFFTASFGEGAFEMTGDKVPAAHMVKMFQTAMKGGGTRYYKKGIGHFFEVMAEAVKERGGTLLMNTRVESIDLEGGTVRGVTTKSGEKYTAPIIVSSAGIRQTVLKLVGEEHFAQEYVESVKRLKSNLACIGFRYFVNKPILEVNSVVLFPYNCLETWEDFEKMARGEKKPTNNYIYIGTKSVILGISPEEKQIIYAVMSCTPDPKQDVQPYLDYIEERTATAFPELYEDGVIERKEIMSLPMVISLGNDSVLPGQGGESYGIANSIGQSGPDQPRSETPIPGLYLVGNDAGGFGLGTHQAVDSGFNLFELLSSNNFVNG